ncbi:MAG: PAS domain S-box protein, partial [Pseudomonadales bacterium]
MTERKHAERLFGSLLESAPDSMVIVSEQGKIVMVNAQTEALFGYARDELIGKRLEVLIPERIRRRHREHRRVYTSSPHLRSMGSGLELYGLRRDGSEFPADISLSYIEPDDGGLLLSCAVRDITERKRTEDALFEEKERLRATLLSIGDAVITTDPDGIIEYLNPVAEKHTGWTLEEARGQRLENVFHIIHEQSRGRVNDPVAQCLEEGGVVRLADQTSLIGRDGEEVSIQDTAAVIRSRAGVVLGVVLVFSDVTQTRRMERQLIHQATHDALTGLICRKEFERRLERVLDSVRDGVDEHALCYLDLDQFKVINDSCGHMAGDELLRQLGGLLSKLVRRRDTLARLGGDEFGILMEHCKLAQARRRANALRRAISDYRFVWDGKTFRVGASIGLVPVTAASGTIADVLSAADNACYAAKDQGRNRTYVYHEMDADVAQRHREMQWVGRINEALEDNRLRLSLQPIVPAIARERAGDHYELLLRMVDEEGQIVMPRVFLPAAERYGL